MPVSVDLDMLSPHLSFSQAMQWLRCPRQWFFRHIEGLKMPPAGATVVGTAIHGSIEYLNRTKAITSRPAPKSEVLDVFSAKFDEMAPDAIWDEEKPHEAKDRGYKGLSLYWDTAAELLQPASPEAVEEKIVVPLPEAGVELVGYTDLRTEEGEIVEYKTASRRLSEVPDDVKLQLALYEFAYRAVGIPVQGRQAWYIIAGKQPDVLPFDLGRANLEEIKWWLQTLARIRQAMETACEKGLFLPAMPGQWWCTPKWCGYWDECHRMEW